eukprot:1157203-Pelagomonas_calceolata.AAC.1
MRGNETIDPAFGGHKLIKERPSNQSKMGGHGIIGLAMGVHDITGLAMRNRGTMSKFGPKSRIDLCNKCGGLGSGASWVSYDLSEHAPCKHNHASIPPQLTC